MALNEPQRGFCPSSRADFLDSQNGAPVSTSARRRHGRSGDYDQRPRLCADDGSACDRVERRLEALFVGSREDADRALAHKLASAAMKVLHEESAPRIIVAPIAGCAANDADACNRIANVLASLFTGSDAQLDASGDRAFARAFASRLVSEVHP